MTEPKSMTQDRAGMSEREYASHAGISRGAVQKSRATGRLVLHADGSIDAAGSDALRVQATNPAMRRDRHEPSMRPVPAAVVGAVADTLREGGMSPPVAAGGMTFLQARTANEVLKAQERKLRLDKARRSLVDLDKVAAHVFRIGRQERDAWLNWPARVAAIIAAEVGVDGRLMRVALDKHVREHLNELSEIDLPTADLDASA